MPDAVAATCACSYGKLRADNKSCEALKTFLAVMTENSIAGIDLDLSNTVEAIQRINGTFRNSIEFIYKENALLLQDTRRNEHIIETSFIGRLKARRTCDEGYFKCREGRCIPTDFECDYDQYPPCQNGTFMCRYGRCIDNGLRCNGVDNCNDGYATDEADCHEFKCEGSGRCIPNSWKCDGDEDCNLGEDEPPKRICENITSSCSDKDFRCANGKCIATLFVCNGINDCGDNTDEKHSLNCSSRPCPPDSFTCKKNKERGIYPCISSDKVCNGVYDCLEKEDEHECPVVLCDEGYFTCRSGECVPEKVKCDYVLDCEDGSDESTKCSKMTYTFSKNML
ncbi:VLDLR-like protein [Mya arenaria]|uniref:VLDLR-like protein n=1 Tax=Mya arenaria TaxID=6604 RepID=A0ABY7ESD1_MYAAR|nr:VLDLR-like protein [Mya arenaria]